MQYAKIQRQGKNLQKANKLRGNDIFIKDFSGETMKLRKQLWKELKACTELLLLRREGFLQIKLTSLAKCYINI